jgi:hypothetical protein
MIVVMRVGILEEFFVKEPLFIGEILANVFDKIDDSFDMKELNEKLDLDSQELINFIFEVKKHFIKLNDMALEQFKEFDDVILNKGKFNQDTLSCCDICDVVFEHFFYLIFENQKQNQFEVRVVVFL